MPTASGEIEAVMPISERVAAIVVDPVDCPPGDVPAWRTWSPHPHLFVPANEFTVHQTMGSPVFVMSQLLDNAWAPTATARNRSPRPEDELYGRLFLP